MELDGARALEVGHPSAGKLDELLLAGRGAIAEDHQRFDALAPLGVGNTYDGNFSHRRVLVEAVLDFDGRDVFAPADDHVFLAVSDRQVPELVDLPAVARLEPAVLDRVSRLLEAVPNNLRKRGWSGPGLPLPRLA